MYGNMPLHRMFIKCAVPGIIAQFIWAICSITDGIFVGQELGSDALAAVNMAWPLVMIVTAIAEMIASGSMVRISMSLGDGDEHTARVIFTNSNIALLILSFVVMGFALPFAEPIMHLLGATDGIAEMGAQYLQVFALFMPLCLLFFSSDNYLRVCGKVNFSMYVNVGVAVLNIVLDVIFLIVLDLGVWAAALATSLSIAVGTVIMIIPFLRKKLVLWFVRGRMSASTWGNVLYNGSSDFFTSVSGSIFMVFTNWMVMAISGPLAVSAFGIMMYVHEVMTSVMLGMSYALSPAISYNHGSGNGRRVAGITEMLFGYAIIMAVATAAIVLLFSGPLVSVFIDNDPALMEMSKSGMQIFGFSYLFSWITVITMGILTSVNRPRSSLILGMLSQVVFPVGFMLLLSGFGLNGIWWSMTVAALASSMVSFGSVMMMKRDKVFTMHDPVVTEL